MFEISGLYLPLIILYTSIMSPLGLLYDNDGSFRRRKRSSYDKSESPGISFVAIFVYFQSYPQGLAVIFSHRQVYVKREGRTLFLLPKVKVEFRHLCSLQKRFSLCSYHNINENIVVFC